MSESKDELHQHNSNASEQPKTNGTEPQPKKKRGCLYYLLHFWWVWLLALIVIVLVVVLPIVYVYYPKKAQSDVNNSKLNVTAMSIRNPRNDSFDLEMTTVLETHSNFHPDIFAFDGSLYLGNTSEKFLTIPIPKVHAHNGAILQVTTHSVIQNATNFTDYALATVKNKTLDIQIVGKTKLKLGSLHTASINYNKTVTVNGMNGLEGLTITDLSLISNQADGANMNGTAHIPNPSVQTIDLGNLTVNLFLPVNVSKTFIPLFVGTAVINNTVIVPGMNTYPMRATLNQTSLLGVLTADPSVAKPLLPMLLTGRSVEFDGQEIPWLTLALAYNTVSINLDVVSALNKAGLGALLNPTSSSSSAASTTPTGSSTATVIGTSSATSV